MASQWHGIKNVKAPKNTKISVRVKNICTQNFNSLEKTKFCVLVVVGLFDIYQREACVNYYFWPTS